MESNDEDFQEIGEQFGMILLLIKKLTLLMQLKYLIQILTYVI